MKFLIDKQIISADQQLYLANFEFSVKQYIESILKKYPTLGVTPIWSVVERKDKFFILESNADFDIKDSLFVNSNIDSYIKAKLFVDFPECSLLLNIKYRMIPQEKENKEEANRLNQVKNDDGLPTFLPQTPRYSFDQINDIAKSCFYRINYTFKHTYKNYFKITNSDSSNMFSKSALKASAFRIINLFLSFSNNSWSLP
jgi:hypothetical protein